MVVFIVVPVAIGVFGVWPNVGRPRRIAIGVLLAYGVVVLALAPVVMRGSPAETAPLAPGAHATPSSQP